MTRHTDWRRRLTAYLAEKSRQPFEEGRNDCALFAAGAVQAMTGRDPAGDWRGAYDSTLAGMRALKEAGYDDHVAFAAAHFEEKPAAFARPGDIAVVPGPDGPALGIVQGPGIYVLNPAGLAIVPLTAAHRAFGV